VKQHQNATDVAQGILKNWLNQTIAHAFQVRPPCASNLI
jgi:hypothetical protein